MALFIIAKITNLAKIINLAKIVLLFTNKKFGIIFNNLNAAFVMFLLFSIDFFLFFFFGIFLNPASILNDC